jgi:biotin carboxyl carrier protein
MDLFYTHKGQIHKVTVEDRGEILKVQIGERVRQIRPRLIEDHVISLDLDGAVRTVSVAESRDKMYMGVRGRVFVLEKTGETAFGRVGAGGAVEKVVRAPMPGQVVKIDVKEGDEVRKNQILGAVEAMKMEHDIRAPVDGVVKKVHVEPGQLVDSEEALVEVE